MPEGLSHTPEESPSSEPPKRRGWWPFRGREQSEVDPEERADLEQFNQDSEQYQQDMAESKAPEKIKNFERIPNSPEELREFVESMDAVQWRERKIQEKYGAGRLGKFKAFLAGERDFTMDTEGQMRRTSWNKLCEVGRRTLTTVFNRRVATAAGITAAAAVLSGGMLLPAAAAVFGSVAGRGAVEAWRAINGKEGRLRERIARVQYRQWEKMHQEALDSQKEGISEVEKNQKITEIINSFYQPTEGVAELESELASDEKKWARRKNWGMFLGGIAGGIFGAGLAHLGKEMMRMDIDGNGVSHLVEKVNGSWHYVFNNSGEAALSHQLGAKVVTDAFGRSAHALGESSAAVAWGAIKNVMPLGAVFGGLWLGKATEKIGKTDLQEAQAERQAVSDEERNFLLGEMPVAAPEAPMAPAPATPTEAEAAPPKKEAKLEYRGPLDPFNLESILGFASKEELESKESYLESLKKVAEVLKGKGAIVELKKGIPTIIVPDLHGRREFLAKVLNKEIDGKKVFDLLKAGRINIVCLGDGMHTEKAENWTSGLLQKEMVESLGTMKMVMELKAVFPDSFHYLRGNHDEVMGGFYKYANEFETVRTWIKENFGEDFLGTFAAFEEALPLVAVAEKFAAAHAAPREAYSKDQINAREKDFSHRFRWTDNTAGESSQAAVEGTLANLGVPGGKLIIGHRPVNEGDLMRKQFKDKLIQINNPKEMVMAMVGSDGKISPEKLS